MWCRISQDRVRDHDGWDVEATEDLEYIVSVSAPVEPVFVLDHGDIELIQRSPK